MTFIRALLAAVLLSTVCIPSLHAQPQGRNLFAHPYPETGRWGPRDGSRTGVFLEIQNGIAAGLWAGYDAEGEAAWLSFSGPIEPLIRDEVPADQIGWELISELTEFSGGGCIVIGAACGGGESTGDFAGEFRHFIRLRFTERSAATLDVLPARPLIGTPPPGTPEPEGPEPGDEPIFGPIDIVPLYFGVDAPALDPTRPLKRIPDFEGVWAAALANVVLSDADSTDHDYEAAGIVQIGPREIQTFELDPPMPGDVLAEVRHPVIDESLDRIPENSEIVCRIRVVDSGETQTNCDIFFPIGPLAGFNIEDYSDTRFNILIRDDLLGGPIPVIQLHRLNYD